MHGGSASSGSPETIFTGVRFVLFGFDSVSEAQYRSELVCRGGTDVGRYDSSCTHVIICGRVHDDPVCVAALQDGKALVSELWIDDSLDFGALADTERVLYKPVKDLNGIPGCESLCICLTGYQRQERDDIMRMVSLMGARFSKPLIANQVTHLVCYKFEGEKYELAKKVNIKLVNHRWLEDCLKAWEILPTDNYIKSGWELEILDAEARDSEEEAVDPGNTLRNQILTDPSSSLGGVAEKSKAQQVTKPAQQTYSSEDCLRNNIFSTPYKEATSGRALDTFLNTKPLEASIHKDAMGIIHAYDNCVIKDAASDRSESKLVDANLNKDGNVLPSTLTNVKQHSPLTAVADGKSGNQSYSRKTPRKLVSAEEPSTMLPPPKRNLEASPPKLGEAIENHVPVTLRNVKQHSPLSAVADGKSDNKSYSRTTPRKLVSAEEPSTMLPPPKRSLEASPPKLGEAIENHVPVDIPNPTSDATIQYSKVHSSSLPQKRKSVFDVGEKSPKLGVPDLNTRVPQSPSARARIEPPEATTVLPHSHSSISNGPAGTNFSSDEAAITSSNASEQAAVTKFKSISYKKRSVKPGQPALGSKTSSAVSHFEGNKADMLIDELREISDAPMSIADKLAAVETKMTYDASPTNRVLPAHNQKATDKQPGTKSRGRTPGRSRIGVRTVEAALPKDIAPKLSLGASEISEPVSNSELNSNISSDTTGRHTAMSDVANASTEEPGETCTLQQQQERVLSLDSRNSEIRKLSSSTSDVPCKENDVKAATFAHTKKVVSKKTLGSKKRSAANSFKDKAVASSNITATNEAAAEPSIVGKVKTDTPGGDVAITTTNEPGEACTLQQQGGDSASDVPCKVNDVKAATFVHTKKVDSKKSLGSKKPSAANSSKDKVVASSNITATNETAAEPSIVGKVKTETPGGDVAIATTDEPGEACTLLQQGGDSASDVPCKENDAKAATFAHTKKVVSKKNLGSKKRSAGNSTKDKVASSDTTATHKAAVEPSIVGKVKTDTPGGDIAIATTDKCGETCTLQQQDGVLSPDCRDSDIRKLSSSASDAACNENDGKVTAVHTKKMVSKRSFGSKKHSTVNSRKCEVVASLDRTTTSKEAAAEPSTVEKLKAEHKLESGTSGVKTGVEKPVSLVDKVDVIMGENAKITPQSASGKGSKITAMDGMDTPMDPEKENKPRENGSLTVHTTSRLKQKVVSTQGRKLKQESKSIAGKNKKESQTNSFTRSERPGPARFMLSGHRLQRKEFQTVIKRLKGRLCWDSHNWSYQATHLIVPDPLRRTEKFFAAAAAGRWILKTDYLTASLDAGRFLDEEPFEWYKKGLTEDGAISLEAPRRWRLLRERTGHGALYGLRLIIYGDCFAPTLDTLKRAVKAGDGTILATSPPYNRFLKSGADYAIISPGIPHVDIWVQEFLRHEIPCIAADYLVEYVCKPGYFLERHVLYKTHAWADKSFANLLSRSEEVVTRAASSPVDDLDDVSCTVCGSREMEEVMLICGDEGGLLGCGSATHIGCCDPPLEAVPDGDWFCPKCSISRTSKGRPLKSRKLSSSTSTLKSRKLSSSTKCK